MRLSKIYLVLLLALTLFSCRKDQSSEPVTTTTIGEFEVVNNYTIDVQGFVTNPDGVPLENVVVRVEGEEARTTESGTFYLEKLVAPETGLYLLAEAPGYFKGGSTVYSHSNNIYTVNIVLIPFDQLISFESGSGLNFTADNGANLSIEANTIVDETGAKYDGAVETYMYWIDPTAANMPSLSPGPLVGLQDGELQSLRSFGMIGVEMYGDNGQELNIAEGENASLTFPVPSEIQSDAPAEIELWHFNESTGLWDIEGVATLVNGSYEASVPHFSWWNCDVPSSFSQVCFQLVDESGRPIGNLAIALDVDGFGNASAWVDATGMYCNLVPAGEELNVSILTFCGDVLLSQTIPPVGDQETVQIEVPLGSSSSMELNIAGVVTCGAEGPISNGFVTLNVGTVSYLDYLDDDGNYSINVIVCSEGPYDASVSAYDLDGLTSGAQNITLLDSDVVANIDGCDEELGDEILILTDLNGTAIYQVCQAYVTAAEITIVTKLDSSEDDNSILLGIDGFGVGEFTGNILGPSVVNFQDEQGLTQFNITSYSDIPGEKIAGTFVFEEFSGSFIAEVQ